MIKEKLHQVIEPSSPVEANESVKRKMDVSSDRLVSVEDKSSSIQGQDVR
jgi:hypothetical protein